MSYRKIYDKRCDEEADQELRDSDLEIELFLIHGLRSHQALLDRMRYHINDLTCDEE